MADDDSTASAQANGDASLPSSSGHLSGLQEEQQPTHQAADANAVPGYFDGSIPQYLDDDEMTIIRSLTSRPRILEIVISTLQQATITTTPLGEGGYINGGFGAVPASAAVVADLKKREFRARRSHGAASAAGGGSCGICLDDIEDGEEVSVMPCSGGHEFHPQCIAKWLGISNMCPLCRHQLPTASMA